MVSCAIKWCGMCSLTSSVKKNGITFHRFPTCPTLKSKWIDATTREGWFPTKHSKICSRHFTEDCFHNMKGMRRRLMDTAVPTLYLPVLMHQPSVSSSQDATLSTSNNKQTEPGSGVPTGKRKLSPLPNNPSAYNSPTEKRLCRRILELENTVQRKNKMIKKQRDCNRFMKKRIKRIKSLVAELENKNLILTENVAALSTV